MNNQQKETVVTVPSDIRDLLDEQAHRINSPAFISSDPVQFPRRFSKLQDIEITALLSAIIAWGKRTMICRNAERLLSLMDYDPYAYVMDEGYEDIDPEMNLHRTFFARHFQYFLRGLRQIYMRNESLDSFAKSIHADDCELPAWELVRQMQHVMCETNGGEYCSQCLPTNLEQTALKRINMALRWLVRDDGIVDLGVWHSISKKNLYIPLDVHVGNTARDLALVTRKANDRKAVVELTSVLRTLRPDDPVYYDFALFGIGVGV